jgi:hypothetical protein
VAVGQGFRVDPRRVVHETIDGEVILIHLETGNYYSLNGGGAEIWELLGRHASASDVARELAHRHGEAQEALAPAVNGLLGELAAEGLIDVTEPAPGEESAGDGLDGPAGGFPRPVLTRYTDMQDFLLVDPIHEVADSGWPNRR